MSIAFSAEATNDRARSDTEYTYASIDQEGTTDADDGQTYVCLPPSRPHLIRTPRVNRLRLPTPPTHSTFRKSANGSTTPRTHREDFFQSVVYRTSRPLSTVQSVILYKQKIYSPCPILHLEITQMGQQRRSLVLFDIPTKVSNSRVPHITPI